MLEEINQRNASKFGIFLEYSFLLPILYFFLLVHQKEKGEIFKAYRQVIASSIKLLFLKCIYSLSIQNKATFVVAQTSHNIQISHQVPFCTKNFYYTFLTMEKKEDQTKLVIMAWFSCSANSRHQVHNRWKSKSRDFLLFRDQI